MTGSRGFEDMGQDRIRYLVFVQGRWRWRPTATMRRLGFRLINLSRGVLIGGRNLPTADDKAEAIRLNADWDRTRGAQEPPQEPQYPRGSVGDGYTRSMALRASQRVQKHIVWTKEHEGRDDWPRAWRWIGPVYGDVDPRTITPEDMLAFRAKVAARVSEGEAFRVIKVWRALWKRMARMRYCDLAGDPSLAFANSAPEARSDSWTDREVKRLVQRAWRLGYRGLAACIAVSWDSQLSPIDARKLTPAQRRRDATGTWFSVARSKTGRAAAATLGRWSEALLDHYLGRLGVELHDHAPLFRTRHILPGPRGGRTWLPRPYTKDKLGKDFAAVRAAVFGDGERRQLADMRRSGTVEAFAGGAQPGAVSSKMANTLAASSRLQKVYNPVDVTTVRQVDQAREAGRARMREQNPDESVTPPAIRVSRPTRKQS